MFGIDESYCTIWWKMVQEKEEKLWRIMLMKMLRNDWEEYQNEREKRLLTYAYAVGKRIEIKVCDKKEK